MTLKVAQQPGPLKQTKVQQDPIVATTSIQPEEATLLEKDPNPTYVLEAVEQSEHSSDDLNFEEVAIEEYDDYSSEESEEDLDKAVRYITEKAAFNAFSDNKQKEEEDSLKLTQRPEVIDDFIRNYLMSKGLVKTLEAFQNEWYEHQQKGKLPLEDVQVVPDVYQRNQDLENALSRLRSEVDQYKEVASKARATYGKLRKERDFHRMHHNRVIQEKSKLLMELKNLKSHCATFEPTIKQLQHKYEASMKEKMLVKLEKDKYYGKVLGLENAVKHLEKALQEGSLAAPQSNLAPIQPASLPAKVGLKPKEGKKAPTKATSTLPTEDIPNPFANDALPYASPEKMRKISEIHGHKLAITSVKFHPKKMILATTSDDKEWKMWAFPSCELIMTGDGHKDWIADCDFHPRGNHIATASGDNTVKVWNFNKESSTVTLREHTKAVWSVSFHYTGDFLASCSMDHTAKLWDINSGKCRQSFRGHVDSVNYCMFVPYSSTLLTASSDKSISLWDTRTGLSVNSIYGHTNSVNCVAMPLKGTLLGSCDADGGVRIWDVRTYGELLSIDCGPYPANKLCFDPSGTIVAVASGDTHCKLFNVRDNVRIKDIKDSNDALQATAFDRSGEYLVTCTSDGYFKVYS